MTTGPAPEWEWYDNTDLKVGDAHGVTHPFLLHEEIEELLAEIREREARRIPPGFQIPPAAE